MNIEINTGTLKSDTNRMKEQIQKVRNAVNSMNEAVSALNGMWEGSAKNAFNVQYVSDIENMEAVCSEADRMVEGMSTAADKYDSCDSQIKNIINSIKL